MVITPNQGLLNELVCNVYTGETNTWRSWFTDSTSAVILAYEVLAY